MDRNKGWGSINFQTTLFIGVSLSRISCGEKEHLSLPMVISFRVNL